MITTKWLGTPFPFFQSGTPVPVPPIMVGVPNDMQARLTSQIPAGWMAIKAPNRDIVFGGIADGLSWAYQLLQYVKAQTRLLTSTDFMLDLKGYDFLGTRIRRRTGQPDDSWRSTIQKEIFRQRNTRLAILAAVTDLTGGKALAFEPKNPQDSGGWGNRTLLTSTHFALNAAGGWGSRNRAWTIYIWAGAPVAARTPKVSGWKDARSGWGARGFAHGSFFAFLTRSETTGVVTNRDVYNTINGTRAAGVTSWVKIGGVAPWALPPVTIMAAQPPALISSIYIDELLLLGP